MFISLSTIHFYIILKQDMYNAMTLAGLSTIHFYIILKPYTGDLAEIIPFEHHTFLHHSQTEEQL